MSNNTSYLLFRVRTIKETKKKCKIKFSNISFPVPWGVESDSVHFDLPDSLPSIDLDLDLDLDLVTAFNRPPAHPTKISSSFFFFQKKY